MAYVFPQKVLFKHCDPAGIVFYPRYFEMINDCIEAFFDDVLGLPFSTIHPENAVPTAEITTRFRTPGKLGDHLRITLHVTRVGRSSIGFRLHAACEEETRFETQSTLVLVNELGRPKEWPDAVRDKMKMCLEDDGNET